MRRFLLLFFLLVPAYSWAASCSSTNISNNWTCVISTSKAVGSNGGSTTGVNTSTANLLVFADAEYAGQGSPTTPCIPTDTIGGNPSGNTWTLIKTFTDSGTLTTIRLWAVTSPAVGATHVVTCTSTGIFSAVAFAAYKYTAAGSPTSDQNNAAQAASSATIQPGSITPGFSNELVITAVNNPTNGVSASSIDSSFTIVENIATASGTNEGIAYAHVTQSTAVAVNPTWTLSSSVPPTFSAAIASFMAATGGAGQLVLIGVGK